jgi:hypothetical protein
MLWRSYAWVEDWRLLNKMEQAGEHIEASRKSEIDTQLKLYGHQFYTEKVKKRVASGQHLPDDPYRRDRGWHGTTVRSILDEVGGLPLYKEIYQPTSGWIHWSPGAVGKAIERDQQKVLFAERDSEMAATALAVGLQFLFESLSELNNHFEHGFDDQLADLREAYIVEIRSI